MNTIALNALVLNDSSGGLGIYLVNMIKHLLNVNRKDILICLEYSQIKFSGNKVIRLRTSKYAQLRVLHEYFLWNDVIKSNNVSLFHSPISYTPIGVNVPSLITIHDLGFYHFPENYTSIRQKFLERMIRRSAIRAEKIIAISEFTKQDIIKTLGVSDEKIRVIHEGIDVDKFSKTISESKKLKIFQEYRIDAPYILSVGHLEPRKNYVRLIQAYEILKKKYGISHKLIIVGQENWKYQNIYNEVDRLNLRSDVFFTRFIEDDTLVWLYQNADLFVTASTYEGFGFTPLESMAAGTPVVASKSTSIPEITGDAAQLFNPYDPDDIAEKMIEVLMDKDLSDSLRKKGKQNIKRFSWDRCCSETVKLYDEILNDL